MCGLIEDDGVRNADLVIFDAVKRANILEFPSVNGGGTEVHSPGRGCLVSLVLQDKFDTQVGLYLYCSGLCAFVYITDLFFFFWLGIL